jgi:hypothetical protein
MDVKKCANLQGGSSSNSLGPGSSATARPVFLEKPGFETLISGNTCKLPRLKAACAEKCRIHK